MHLLNSMPRQEREARPDDLLHLCCSNTWLECALYVWLNVAKWTPDLEQRAGSVHCGASEVL